MGTTNSDIINRFLTSPNRGSYHPKGKHCGFDGDVFYSFGHAIATLAPARNKQSKICFITTQYIPNSYVGQHIELIKNLSPWEVIPVCNVFDIDDSIIRMSNNLAHCVRQYKAMTSSWHENYYRGEIQRQYANLLRIHIRYKPVAIVSYCKKLVSELGG